MQDSKTWHMWLMWLMIACLAITPNLLADDDDEDSEEPEEEVGITVKGYGEDEESAIGDGFRSVMLKHVRDNIEDRGDYNTFESKIDGYIVDNWRRYVVGDPEKPTIRKRFNKKNGYITIEVKIKGDELMADIKQQFLRAGKKLEGFGIVVLHTDDPFKMTQDEQLDHTVGFDTLQDSFGKYGARFYDLKAVQAKMEVERVATGQSAYDNVGAYIKDKFDAANIIVYVQTKSVAQQEPTATMEVYTWQVKMNVKVLWRQTGEVLATFELASGERNGETKIPYATAAKLNGNYVPSLREARAKALKVLAGAVGEQIAERLANRSKVLSESTYVIQFVNFSNKMRERIQKAMRALEASDTMKIKSSKGSDNLFQFEIKWAFNAHSQAEVSSKIKAKCLNQQVKVVDNNQSQGVIIFTPEE